MSIRIIAGGAGEVKRTMDCKTIHVINTLAGGRSFPATLAITAILKNVRMRTSSLKKNDATRNCTTSEAERYFFELVRDGYIIKDHIEYPQKGKPSVIPPGGLMFYRVSRMKSVECSEMPWYKSLVRKRKYVEGEGKVDTVRCKAMRKLYSLFGYQPFTYDMATKASKYLKEYAQSEGVNLSKTDRATINAIARSYTLTDEEFHRVWNSLVRNNYITPHVIRKGNTLKKTGAYVLNRNYVRKCLFTAE